MKKLIALAILCAMAMGSFAQDLNKVWLDVRNENYFAARKKVEECMPYNQTSAKAWTYRGTIYIKLYEQEQERLKKDSKYSLKFPDAAYIAYESFYKALEINPKFEISEQGILAPQYGQEICAAPIYYMGEDAYKKKDMANAEKYFNTAAKCFNTSGQKDYAGICYIYLMDIKKNDPAALKEVLDAAIKAKTNKSDIYQLAYELYSKEENMEECGKIINTAKKNVKEGLTDILAIEIGYLSKTNDTVKLAKAFANVEKYDSVPEFIATCANYLVEAKDFDKAVALLTKGQAKNPNSFDINNMLGYCYYMNAVELGKKADDAAKSFEYELSGEYRTAQREMMATAHDWCEKAFTINNADKQNAMMLQQLKLQLGKEVPAELKEAAEGKKATQE